MNSFWKIFFALFLCVAAVSALPKRMGYMEIYKCVYDQFFYSKIMGIILLFLFRECKARYGTKPQIECK